MKFPGVEMFRGNSDDSSTFEKMQKLAQENLLKGVETLCHWHFNQASDDHSKCEIYVLDWYDELPWRDFKQVALIT